MSLFYQEILQIFSLLLFSIFLSLLIIFLSSTVGANKPNTEKLSAYECGFDPYEDARNVFDVRFYLVAIFFLIFDLEAVYFLPWSASISLLNLECFWYMIDFTIELFAGFIYAWKIGAFDWE